MLLFREDRDLFALLFDRSLKKRFLALMIRLSNCQLGGFESDDLRDRGAWQKDIRQGVSFRLGLVPQARSLSATFVPVPFANSIHSVSYSLLRSADSRNGLFILNRITS